jgi:hypothetical protein
MSLFLSLSFSFPFDAILLPKTKDAAPKGCSLSPGSGTLENVGRV